MTVDEKIKALADAISMIENAIRSASGEKELLKQARDLLDKVRE